MKFVIPTQEFNYLINKCLNVVASKATIPILSNILIEAVKDELILTATDLTVGIRCSTEAKILEEGATTLPAKKLAQLTRELTSMNVEVTTIDDITHVVADSSKFKLHGMNSTEYPSLPNMESAVYVKIQQSQLKEALYRTSFAVSREDTRYVLTGIHMHIHNGEISFVGTDGKRLAKAKMALELEPNISVSLILPLKAVEEILKNLSDEGTVTLGLLSDKISVQIDGTTMITKLLSGDYPDVNRVIPENSETIVTLHREELMTLLRQISLFATDTTHPVRFVFNEGELRLSANTSEVGEGKVSMPVNYPGPSLEIAFNPNFFLDILRHSRSETVTIGVTDAFNPGIIIDQDADLKLSLAKSLFVLMPMRLSD